MPQARTWAAQADVAICNMRQEGLSWADIGRSLGLSRNTVIERGRRLNAVAAPRPKMAIAPRSEIDDPNRAALPAGHALTWGLLSNEPYPKEDEQCRR